MNLSGAALLGTANPDAGGSTLMLATVTAATSASCTVKIDGATTATTAQVVSALQPSLFAASAVGARVMGCLVGRRFYVTDLVSPYPQAFGYSGTTLGPFSNPVAPGTTIASFGCCAGALRATVTCSGYTSNGASVAPWCHVYFDALYVADVLMNVGTATNQHMELMPGNFQLTTTAGVHTISLVYVAGNFDANDRATVFVHVDPA